MAFSTGNDSGGPMAEINVTPLVDVMLVLLIIFMITAPLMSHKVKIVLPQATVEKQPEDTALPISIAVQENGAIYWNDERMQQPVLESRLAVEAQKTPQPTIEIRADAATRYRLIQQVVKASKDAGIRKVSFVTTPER